MSTPRLATLSLLLLSSAALLSAANITYDVNLSIEDGTVSGQITTDGAFGSLFGPDIVGENLLVTSPCVGNTQTCIDNPTISWDIQNEGLDLVNGDGAFYATPTDLIFNFSAGNDGYLYFAAGSPYGSVELCFSDIADCFGTPSSGGAIVGESLFVGGLLPNQPVETEALSGAQVIASADTPEPSTALLTGVVALAAGLLLISRTRTTTPI